MPRTKRTLADADPNANTTSAAKKRATKTTTKVDEEPVKAAAPRKNANTAARWVITKKPGPKKGATTSKKATSASTKKASTTGGSTTTKKDTTEEKDTAKPKDASSVKFVTFCPPWGRREEPEDEDEGEGEDEDEDADDGCGKDCKCNKPLADNPTWPWRITEDGWKLYRKLAFELMKRDQDMHGVYIYNDFTGYGYQEVFENQLVAFNKEMMKKRQSPVSVWVNMEALGMILNGDIAPWEMCDDAETLTETVILFGVALLTTLDILKSHNLLKPDSPIVNIPFIVSLFLSFAATWEENDQGQGETGWKFAAVKMLDKAGIEFVDGQVARGTQKRLEAIREEMGDDHEEDDDPGATWTPEDDQDEDGARQWNKWHWQTEFALFSKANAKVPAFGAGRNKKSGSIGGTHYDITKFGKAEKKRYELGGSGFLG